MSHTDRGLDRLLDRAVVPGYTALGYAVRRRSWPDDDPRPAALTGRRALVTGAAGGIGEATAAGLARLGATVHLLVRSGDRAAAAVERITTACAEQGRQAELLVEECDVSDLTAVRRFAEPFAERLADAGEALDVVVHNAGVMPPERTTSADGHELTMATHLLGPMLMTELLLPALRRSEPGARTIWIASGGMYTQALPVDDPEFLDGRYRGAVAYARSKRAQVELAPRLTGRWSPDRVAVHTMHPGWVDTPGVASSLPLFGRLTGPLLRDPAAGADTIVWLAATEPAPPSGAFWHDRQQRPASYLRRTRPSSSEVDRMWDWARRTSGLADG